MLAGYAKLQRGLFNGFYGALKLRGKWKKLIEAFLYKFFDTVSTARLYGWLFKDF